MKKDKPELFTYEELTTLCHKQEKYIKELENKLDKYSSKECVQPAKPNEDELIATLERQSDKIREQESTINALLYSLAKTNVDRLVNDDTSRHYREEYAEEHRRANRIWDKLEKQDNILEELKCHIELKEATVNRDGKEYEIAWVKSQGFVVKGTKPYEILKNWIEENKKGE